MQNQANKIQSYLLKNIPKHPHDIVRITMEKFHVTRTTVLRHVQHLVKKDLVTKTGLTKQITYSLNSSLNKNFVIDLHPHFDEFDFFSKHISALLANHTNANTYAIGEYVITEMLNNCKDHAQGKKANVAINFKKDTFHCCINDDGVGVFKTLALYYHFTDIREVIFELSKGKLTSDPVNHSGEGLFFSSRAVDLFTIEANGYCFFRDNHENDWSFLKANKKEGTSILFEIKQQSNRQLENLFKQYTEDLAFTKTDILIELAKHLGERLISRSQAKRVCTRLENFSHITLDFKRVEAVGQGFVDQLFRVYKKSHPDLIIDYINANSSVEYMIKRCLAIIDKP